MKMIVYVLTSQYFCCSYTLQRLRENEFIEYEVDPSISHLRSVILDAFNIQSEWLYSFFRNSSRKWKILGIFLR